MKAAFSAIISGRVQMVLFRDFTIRHAQALGIVGEVENMSDGTVRVHAEGEKKQLEELLALLRKGPLLARVSGVQVSWLPRTGAHATFSIVY
ncbi:hypothetical protein A2841_00985 [Candidatus Kaiserbacteria bacterium RIFCSPHIGHO2_01_FULL_48_10]|uniref:acylphosphatase n=1 Tax=Candidatus Kaiserbacteria bacterium RIFCSPHIGHO2_01_FULL_48_10 TaxID=1798476 RepID=A0A1F6C5A0_9BACT|nr:MAG: hypothetical protein A2841_00985 [Candidatus Kaiserbacteria bacterium RIFCSPHIGHO2_01_FULL_48_10]